MKFDKDDMLFLASFATVALMFIWIIPILLVFN